MGILSRLILIGNKPVLAFVASYRIHAVTRPAECLKNLLAAKERWLNVSAYT